MQGAPGWATAVFGPEGPASIEVGGRADLARDEAVTRATRFRWYSVTKLVTAMATLRAVEAGRLALDDDVRARLDWFRPSAPVTVRHLLAHASGLADPNATGWVHPPGRALRPPGVLARETFARHPRLRSAPGAVARYTNLGYLVLGELLAEVEGGYERAAAAVLARSGAHRASFSVDGAARGHEALASARTLVMAALFGRRTPGLVAYVREGWVGLSPFAIEGQAYGGLVGSIEDLVALGRALLAPGLVLEAPTLRAMRARAASGPAGAYGLGPWLHGDGWIGHGGEAGGFRAELHVHPERGRGFAILVNAGAAPTGARVDELKRA
ncbi:MAG: beta-lactamase family protein [Sandaracinaceae bacterium]|nr:beta-lactamase family protein [Sandaracinaceae bacterium]